MEHNTRDLQLGINSVREDLDKFKEEIRQKLADLHREVTEKLLVQRHELSEKNSAAIYDTKREIVTNISALQELIREELLSIKQEFNTRIDSILTVELDNAKKESKEADKQLEENLMTHIKSRIKIVSGVSAAIFVMLGWLWSYSLSTANKVDTFKQSVSSEIVNLRTEMRTLITNDVQRAIWDLRTRQEKIILLLEAKTNDDFGKLIDQKDIKAPIGNGEK